MPGSPISERDGVRSAPIGIRANAGSTPRKPLAFNHPVILGEILGHCQLEDTQPGEGENWESSGSLVWQSNGR